MSRKKYDSVQLIESELAKRKWRQVDLAMHSGVPASKISLLLKGTKGTPLEAFSLDSLYKLMLALDLIQFQPNNSTNNYHATSELNKQNALNIKKEIGKEDVTMEDIPAVVRAIIKFENTPEKAKYYLSDPKIVETGVALSKRSFGKNVTLEEAKKIMNIK